MSSLAGGPSAGREQVGEYDMGASLGTRSDRHGHRRPRHDAHVPRSARPTSADAHPLKARIVHEARMETAPTSTSSRRSRGGRTSAAPTSTSPRSSSRGRHLRSHRALPRTRRGAGVEHRALRRERRRRQRQPRGRLGAVRGRVQGAVVVPAPREASSRRRSRGADARTARISGASRSRRGARGTAR